MKRYHGWVAGIFACSLLLSPIGGIRAQEQSTPAPAQEEKGTLEVAQLTLSDVPEEGLLFLDFRQADILTVLQALARKAQVNIVTSSDVTGEVTVRLDRVSWEQALDTIVKTQGLAYEKEENVILVTTVEQLKTRREALKELVEIEPVITRVIQLRFLDANDVKTFLEPQLTAQGKISVLEVTGQKGWSFGGVEAGSSSGGSEEGRERKERERSRSKAIVITDTPTTIERLEKILTRVDVLPKQILIESRVMEVNRDLLRDIGLDVATGRTGAETATALPTASPADKRGSTDVIVSEFGGQLLGTAVQPSIFGPKGSIGGAGTAINAGLEFLFRKLRGAEFEVIIRALEEDVRTNTLSAPHILTLSGQEATILVGTKYPILESQVSGTDSTTVTTTLSYYQDIGIELFVVPQVAGDGHIDMIIHPVVSAQNGSVTTTSNTTYPILDIREAETQVIMESGETVVIGGLLKDVKSKSRMGLPFFGKLPLIGPLFSRTTSDLQKIDLLIFITARIVEPGELSEEELDRLREKYEEFLKDQSSLKRARPQRPREEEVPSTASPEKRNHGILYQRQKP